MLDRGALEHLDRAALIALVVARQARIVAPPDNPLAARRQRPLVVARKVSGGTRSAAGRATARAATPSPPAASPATPRPAELSPRGARGSGVPARCYTRRR